MANTYGIRGTESRARPFQKITGIEKLAQLCEKYFLTTYGSDLGNPDTGCLIKTFVGRTFDSLDEVADLIDQEVSRVEDQIIRLQLEEIRAGHKIPLSEQLRSLILVDVSRTDETDLWGVVMTYNLTNKEGEVIEREFSPR